MSRCLDCMKEWDMGVGHDECRSLNQLKLSELDLSFITPGGTRVKSDSLGTEGTITYVSPKPDREDHTLDISWDNGNESKNVWHFWLTKVSVTKL